MEQSTEEVLKTMQKQRSLLKKIEAQRGKIFGYLIRLNNFFRSVIEKKIELRELSDDQDEVI